jgi:hypothetical protein
VLQHIKSYVLYEAPESFYAVAELPPPYSSVRKYDAKLWRFVLQHGQSGDWIWNVGRDVEEAEFDTILGRDVST